jgi:Sensors of blue-light using FAD
MSLSCIAYISKLVIHPHDLKLQMHKDICTRAYAKKGVTGTMLIANGYLFEVLEGDYPLLESILDRQMNSMMLKDPEVLVFSAIAMQHFKTWKMRAMLLTFEGKPNLNIFRSLGEQTRRDASTTPTVIYHLIKEFHTQFIEEPSCRKAA